MAGPLLVWLIFFAMAYGVVDRSALFSDWVASWRGQQLSYRQKFAYRIVFFLLAFFLLLALLLTVLPHAVLLSVTGHLIPSSFSSSFVPALAFVLIVLSATYGKLCGRFAGSSDIFNALSKGISAAAPFFIPFLLAEELWYIVLYVFRL